MSVKSRIGLTLCLLAICLAICEIFISNATCNAPFKAELLLLLTVFSGLYFGPRYGALMGLLSGFLKGLITIDPFGTVIISFFIIGLSSGYLKNRLMRETLLTQFLVSFAASVFFSFMVLVGLKIFSVALPDKTILKKILYQALLTGALSVPFFFASGAIFRRGEAKVFEVTS